MSGKYENKPTGKKKSRKWPWIVLLAVLLLLAGMLANALIDQKTDMPGAEATEAADTMPTAAAETGKTSFSLGEDLEIVKLGKYAGVYMEDGSDEVVSGIMMIIVENKGENTLQYAEITLSGTAGDAIFKLSTLKPGEKAVVLEANRKEYSPTDAYTNAIMDNTVFFEESVSLMEDTFEIQPLDGGFNITNISGEDITGDITVYFKNAADGMYYGGITYRGKIEGGMKAGEIKQIMSRNFTASGTAVVFVTIAES